MPDIGRLGHRKDPGLGSERFLRSGLLMEKNLKGGSLSRWMKQMNTWIKVTEWLRQLDLHKITEFFHRSATGCPAEQSAEGLSHRLVTLQTAACFVFFVSRRSFASTSLRARFQSSGSDLLKDLLVPLWIEPLGLVSVFPRVNGNDNIYPYSKILCWHLGRIQLLTVLKETENPL